MPLCRNLQGVQLTHLEEFKELINEARVQIIGPVRQEILLGIKSDRKFDQLREYLSAFPDIEIGTRDFEQAARFHNLARSKGIQGSNTDFLICAVAARNNLSIFTVDQVFCYFEMFFLFASTNCGCDGESGRL